MNRPLRVAIAVLGALLLAVLVLGALGLRPDSSKSKGLMAAASTATVTPSPTRAASESLPVASSAQALVTHSLTTTTTANLPKVVSPSGPATTRTAVISNVLASPAITATAAVSATQHSSKLIAPKLYTYRVVNVFPHDPAAFTQGLVYQDGVFYEGTGQRGASSLRRVDPQSGNVEQIHNLETPYFGEGITILDDKIYQLTWQEQTGFIYDKTSFAESGQFNYSTEGWGITNDGERLIVSDGTSVLYFWDPATLQTIGGIYVSLFGLPVNNLNELEMVDGEIFANVWKTDLILRIDPGSGQVNGVIDLSELLSYAPPSTTPTDVLNGIAYDAATGRLFVTGKYWPALFEIELIEVTS
jgi:glutamine cyclotransferase